MNPFKIKKNGFSLVELMVVMGLVAVLFTITTLSLSSLDKESRLDELAAEVKTAISQAQSQTTNGVISGVYFETNRLVVFYGDHFTEGDAQNQITILPSGITFSSITLPSSYSITFDQISGYVQNYSSAQSITLTDGETGKTRQIAINKLGVMEVQ